MTVCLLTPWTRQFLSNFIPRQQPDSRQNIHVLYGHTALTTLMLGNKGVVVLELDDVGDCTGTKR